MFISLSLFLCVYVRIRGIEKEAYILLFVQQRESSRKDKVCQREEGEKRERDTCIEWTKGKVLGVGLRL